MKTFIISLEEEAKRRENLIQQGIPIDWVKNYFRAIDVRKNENFSKEVDYDNFYKRYRRKPKLGEIGCSLSHRKIYEIITKTSENFNLILEDDVITEDPEFLAKLQKLENILSSTYFFSSKAVIIHLGIMESVEYNRKVKINRKVLKSLRLKTNNQVEPIWRTHAYIINKKAASKLLEFEPQIQYVADDWQIRSRNKTIDYLFFMQQQYFVPDTQFDSSIQNENDSWGKKKYNVWKELLYKFYVQLLNFKYRILTLSPIILK